MNWTLPGTTLSINIEEVPFIEQKFSAIFLAGGIVLSQVSAITGLESYTIQNWVKRGFLPAPEHKRYNMNQLCRITCIHMLKDALSMEKITGLISYLNGELDDDSDDLIDDAKLYFMFVKLASKQSYGYSETQWDELIPTVLSDYSERAPGARERVEKVLHIMLTAWTAANLKKRADEMLSELF